MILMSGVSWTFLAAQYHLSPATIERLCMRMIHCVAPVLHKDHIDRPQKYFGMQKLKDCNNCSTNHPDALYAVDVRFEQCKRASGTTLQATPYFSDEHKLYGYKCERSVLPNGICCILSKHMPGASRDLHLFRGMESVHEENTIRSFALPENADQGGEPQTMKNIILADKAYYGAPESLSLNFTSQETNRTSSTD